MRCVILDGVYPIFHQIEKKIEIQSFMNDLTVFLDSSVKRDLQRAIRDLVVFRPVDQLSFIADWLDSRVVALDEMKKYMELYEGAKLVQMELESFNEYDLARTKRLEEKAVEKKASQIRDLGDTLDAESLTESGLNELLKRLREVVPELGASSVWVLRETSPRILESVSSEVENMEEGAGGEAWSLFGETAPKYILTKERLLVKILTSEQTYVVSIHFADSCKDASVISGICNLFVKKDYEGTD